MTPAESFLAGHLATALALLETACEDGWTAGTFTTGHAAEIHGRDAIGIDLDPANRDLVDRRRDEVRRALLDVPPEVPGQLTLEALL